MNLRKLRSIVGAVASVAMVLSMVLGSTAQALTASDITMLQAAGIISAAQAASLSASIGASTATVSSGYTFASDLTVGSKGAAVSALQQVLVSGGYLVMPAGVAMGNFGQLTKSAVMKYQAAKGISPVSGFVGPKTRASLNAMGGGVSVTPVGGTVTSAGSVSVALAATSPVNGTVVSPSATALLAQYVFSGSGQVNSVVLQRTGVSSDNTLNNVYLYQGATRLTDAATVANGIISFNSPNGLFTVNGSMTLSVRADIATGQGGETVGVSLISLTTAGSSAAVNVNVSGSTQTIANNATAAGVTIGTNSVSNSSVNAGTVNYNVWSAPVNVSTRSVYLDAVTLKYIGSAPASAFQNLTLYVDGSKVSTTNINSNNFAVFDLSATPSTLTTGGHTIEVHADIVGGANYNGSFTLQNQADIMVADSQLQGVYVAVTNVSSATFSQNVGGTVAINPGSITVSQDPSFSLTQVTGGSTNVAIAQFLLKDFGEAVKISQLTVTPSITNGVASVGATTSLNNVGLYVNGAQVGSLANWNPTNNVLTFNLGSSLVVQAGQTVTLTVKADTINAAFGNYTGGSLSVTLGGVTNNAQGLTSSAISTVPVTGIVSTALTLGVGQTTLAKNTSYSSQSILANTPNQEIGSFMLQQNSSEDAQLTNINVGLGGTFVGTNPSAVLSNLRTSEATTPVNPALTNSFSVNDVIKANTSREIDVFADVGQLSTTTSLTAATGSVTISGTFNVPGAALPITATVNGQVFSYSVTATTTNVAYIATQLASVINASTTSPVIASVTNNLTNSVIVLTSKVGGSVSNYTLTASAGTTGGTVAASGAGNLTGGSTVNTATATIITTLTATAQGKISNSPILVIGSPAQGQTITVTGGALNVGGALVSNSPLSQLVIGGSTFPVAVYNALSTIGTSTITEMDFTVDSSSTISSVTVGGLTAQPVGGTAIVQGLNIQVPQGLGGVNIPVSVTYNTVGLSGLQVDNQASNITLSVVKSQTGNAPIATLNPGVAAHPMYLVASKPTITVSGVGGNLSGRQEIIDVNVAADNAGDVILNTLPITITIAGSGLSITSQQLGLNIDGQAQDPSTYTATSSITSAGATTTPIVFTTPFTITKGTSHTFQVLLTLAGFTGTGQSVQAKLDVPANFKWTDVNGNINGTGANLDASHVTNYPLTVITAVSPN